MILRGLAFLIIVGSPLLLVGCGSGTKTTTTSTSTRQEAPLPMRLRIEGASEAMETRFADGNLLGVAQFYADDAVIIGPGGLRVSGREAIDVYWVAIRDDASDFGWEITTLDINGGRDVAYQRGISRLWYTTADGERQESTFDFMNIWRPGPDNTPQIVVEAYWRQPVRVESR